MAKFRVEGDEDENHEGPSNNRRLPKKPRTSFGPIPNRPSAPISKNSAKYAAAAASKVGNPGSTSAAPSIPLVQESRSEQRSIIEEHNGFGVLGIGSRYHFELAGSPESEEEDDEEEEENVELEEEDDEEEEEEIVEFVRIEDEVQPTETRVAPPPHSLTLTDPSVLDCAICFEPLHPPVYQCENGHIACATCCTNMKNKCAICSMPIGYNRCRAIEKVIESIQIACSNVQYGCKELLSYNKKLDHEKTCNYAPCSCPHPDCTYIGLPLDLYFHFATRHKNSSKISTSNIFSIMLDNNQNHVFLQGGAYNTLFVLNRCIEPRGSFVNVVCIAPVSSTARYSYEVSATVGVSSISLKTLAEMTPQWTTGQPPDKKYLLVPNDFVTSGGQLKLELTIRNYYG